MRWKKNATKSAQIIAPLIQARKHKGKWIRFHLLPDVCPLRFSCYVKLQTSFRSPLLTQLQQSVRMLEARVQHSSELTLCHNSYRPPNVLRNISKHDLSLKHQSLLKHCEEHKMGKILIDMIKHLVFEKCLYLYLL